MQDIKQIDKGVPSKPSGNMVVVPFIFICVLQGTEVSSSPCYWLQAVQWLTFRIIEFYDQQST